MYGKNISYICCAEGSLFMSPDTESITNPYLAKVRQAGAEYKETERISDDTQTYLDTPMLPAEVFVKTVNGIFEGMLNNESTLKSHQMERVTQNYAQPLPSPSRGGAGAGSVISCQSKRY
jgi:hypothetical protein